MHEKSQGHFYGRRKGRPLNGSRQATLISNDVSIIHKLPCEGLSPHSLFENTFATFALEIGFGNGEHLVEQAARAMDVGFIGCEAFINGVTACLAEAQARNVKNIRIWADDALLLLQRLQPETIDKIYLLFSDPWPKTKHHKRRFIQPHTVKRLNSLLKTGGLLRIATDDHNLAQWMLLHCVQEPQFQWTSWQHAQWREIPPDWIETRYQQKAAAQGRQPFFMDFVKV